MRRFFCPTAQAGTVGVFADKDNRSVYADAKDVKVVTIQPGVYEVSYTMKQNGPVNAEGGVYASSTVSDTMVVSGTGSAVGINVKDPKGSGAPTGAVDSQEVTFLQGAYATFKGGKDMGTVHLAKVRDVPVDNAKTVDAGKSGESKLAQTGVTSGALLGVMAVLTAAGVAGMVMNQRRQSSDGLLD